MPKLICHVDTCGHNKEDYCCINKIDVDGERADKSSNTFCASFISRDHIVLNDGMKADTSVDCEAHRCRFNMSGVCDAKHITIDGPKSSSCIDTECASFDLH